MLIGTLLGGATLERKKISHNARLRFYHTFTKHKDYFADTVEELKAITIGTWQPLNLN